MEDPKAEGHEQEEELERFKESWPWQRHLKLKDALQKLKQLETFCCGGSSRLEQGYKEQLFMQQVISLSYQKVDLILGKLSQKAR